MGVSITTIAELTRWLAAAETGAEATYHTGRTGSLFAAFMARPNDVSTVAREMRELEAHGFVYLVQRKLDDGFYGWLALRSSRRLR